MLWRWGLENYLLISTSQMAISASQMARITDVSYPPPDILFIYFFIYLNFKGLVQGFELRAYTLSHSTSTVFVMVFFKIGSQELFARAGFKPQSS
jgi:hypothetical protein